MTAAGFSTALAAFTGQNYGAHRYDRIRRGYRLTLGIAGSIGLFAGLLFFFLDFFSILNSKLHYSYRITLPMQAIGTNLHLRLHDIFLLRS